MNSGVKRNEITWDKTNPAGMTLIPAQTPVRTKNGPQPDGYLKDTMAGKKGQSGPPGNANAFRHGLATVQRRRVDGELTQDERDIRADILSGLIADKGGERQIGTAKRIIAEIISSDVALLVTFNQAIESVIKNNQKARQNPKALAQLDGYKRPLVGSLSANLQRFGMERVAKFESLQEIIEEMREGDAETEDNG
jgi:hypothetical protein